MSDTTKGYCQTCVWETHPEMLTTYCYTAQCDRCHRTTELALVIPRNHKEDA